MRPRFHHRPLGPAPVFRPWAPLGPVVSFHRFPYSPPGLPALYWNAESPEERIKRICLLLDIMEHYLDETTSKINDIIDQYDDLAEREEALLEYVKRLADRIEEDEKNWEADQAEQTVFLKAYVLDQIKAIQVALEEQIRNAKLDDLDIIAPGDSYTAEYHTLHETLEGTYRDLNSWNLDASTFEALGLTAETLDALGLTAEEEDYYLSLRLALARHLPYTEPLEADEAITDASGVLKALNEILGGTGGTLAARVTALEERVSALEAAAPTTITKAEIDNITEGE